MALQGFEEGLGVFEQFSAIEADFTKANVNDGLLVDAILDFASFGFLDSLFDVSGNGASFGIWH